MSADCECPICYENLNASETGRAEMTCGHAFHIKCLVDWFTTNANTQTCPMCRKVATDLEVPTRKTGREREEMAGIVQNYIDYVNLNYNNNIILPNNPLIIEPLAPRTLEDDIDIVARNAGVAINVAAEALQRANGDIVDAIMALTEQHEADAVLYA